MAGPLIPLALVVRELAKQSVKAVTKKYGAQLVKRAKDHIKRIEATNRRQKQDKKSGQLSLKLPPKQPTVRHPDRFAATRPPRRRKYTSK